MKRKNERLPHIWKHRGWWYASEDTQHYRDGKVISGFEEFGALAAKLRGGDEAVIEWSKQNPRGWMSGWLAVEEVEAQGRSSSL